MSLLPEHIEALRQRHIAKVEAMLSTFEVPRKVYKHTSEWLFTSNLWRSFLLSAGETGSDEHGEYQVFATVDKPPK